MNFVYLFIFIFSFSNAWAKLDQYNQDVFNQLSFIPEIKNSSFQMKNKLDDSSKEFKSLITPGFQFTFARKINPLILLNFNVSNFSYKYKNTDYTFLGDTEFNLFDFFVGFNIHAGRGASIDIYYFLRHDDIYAELETTQIEIKEDELAFLRLALNQVVLKADKFEINFRVHYDFSSSGDFIQSRKAFGGRLQFGMSNAEQFFMLGGSFEQSMSEAGDYKFIQRHIGASLETGAYF
jgi:hypothetical protein